ncbi:hypothetical protein GQR58_023959 [Nymphon striatum]|nr:hypothetical protein GQR58_023959 [Nymphon striatum]
MYTSDNNKCTVKIRDKSIDLKETKDLYGRLMVLARSSRDVDQKEAIGNFEFTLTPRALFAPSGFLLPCNDKSKFIHALTNLVPKETTQTPIIPDKKIAVIDGMVLVQKLSKKSPTMATVKDLSETFLERNNETEETPRKGSSTISSSRRYKYQTSYDEQIPVTRQDESCLNRVFGREDPGLQQRFTQAGSVARTDRGCMHGLSGFKSQSRTKNNFFILNLICHSIKKSIVSRLLIVIEFGLFAFPQKKNIKNTQGTGLYGAKFFSKLDAKAGYRSVQLGLTKANQKPETSHVVDIVEFHIRSMCASVRIHSLNELTDETCVCATLICHLQLQFVPFPEPLIALCPTHANHMKI